MLIIFAITLWGVKMKDFLKSILSDGKAFGIVLSDNDSDNRKCHAYIIAGECKFHRFLWRTSDNAPNPNTGRKNYDGNIIVDENPSKVLAVTYMCGVQSDNEYVLFHDGEYGRFEPIDREEEAIPFDLNNDISDEYAKIEVDFNFRKYYPEVIQYYSQLRTLPNCGMPTTIEMQHSLMGIKGCALKHQNDFEYLKNAVELLKYRKCY